MSVEAECDILRNGAPDTVVSGAFASASSGEEVLDPSCQDQSEMLHGQFGEEPKEDSYEFKGAMTAKSDWKRAQRGVSVWLFGGSKPRESSANWDPHHVSLCASENHREGLGTSPARTSR